MSGGPARDGGAGVKHNLEEADDASIVELDARDFGRAAGNRQGESLKEWKVDVDVEGLRLPIGKAVENGEEMGAHGWEMVQTLLETKVGEVVGAHFIAEKSRELLVLFDEGVLPIGAKDVVAMIELFQGGVELTL